MAALEGLPVDAGASDPDQVISIGIGLHFEQKFIDPIVFDNRGDEEDDEERVCFSFGDTCPLELWTNAGAGHACRTYKGKHYCCASTKSDDFARNYLAYHAFESVN